VAGPIFIPQGVAPALATPFDASGTLDLGALARRADRLIAEEVAAVRCPAFPPHPAEPERCS
jgi:dihydrodipicolinate synthase/N-acetylneuraminate lyase